MKRVLILLASLLVAPSALAATTYSFSGSPYNSINNYTPSCSIGPCADYPAGSTVSGQFTTANPLAPNLVNAVISGLITSYSFSDGINTYSNTNPNARIFDFTVNTDANGNINFSSNINLQLWQTGSGSHTVADRVAVIQIAGAGIANAYNNEACQGVATSANTGVADTCIVPTSTPNATSSATASSPVGVWTKATVPNSIPTLSEWGMIVLASLLALGTLLTLRRQRQ